MLILVLSALSLLCWDINDAQADEDRPVLAVVVSVVDPTDATDSPTLAQTVYREAIARDLTVIEDGAARIEANYSRPPIPPDTVALGRLRATIDRLADHLALGELRPAQAEMQAIAAAPDDLLDAVRRVPADARRLFDACITIGYLLHRHGRRSDAQSEFQRCASWFPGFDLPPDTFTDEASRIHDVVLEPPSQVITIDPALDAALDTSSSVPILRPRRPPARAALVRQLGALGHALRATYVAYLSSTRRGWSLQLFHTDTGMLGRPVDHLAEISVARALDTIFGPAGSPTTMTKAARQLPRSPCSSEPRQRLTRASAHGHAIFGKEAYRRQGESNLCRTALQDVNTALFYAQQSSQANRKARGIEGPLRRAPAGRVCKHFAIARAEGRMRSREYLAQYLAGWLVVTAWSCAALRGHGTESDGGAGGTAVPGGSMAFEGDDASIDLGFGHTAGMDERDAGHCELPGMIRCTAESLGGREVCHNGAWAALPDCASDEICGSPTSAAPGACSQVAAACQGRADAYACDERGAMLRCGVYGTVMSRQACASEQHCKLGLPFGECAMCLAGEDHRCAGQILEVCTATGDGYRTLEVCAAPELCDASVPACRADPCGSTAEGGCPYGPGPCARSSEIICAVHGASCENRTTIEDFSYDLCRWSAASTEALCDNTVGIWTAADSTFAQRNPGSVAAGVAGACLSQVSNLGCAPADVTLCERYGATCEQQYSVEGRRHDVCRWHHADTEETCADTAGIWTSATSGFAANWPRVVPPGTPGACVTQVGNLREPTD